ncbi:hypothetical protein [Neolewinella agarilytica]|uniref:Uncharacterized protein n=1 Tax=Neolewinella agarilytica TaxID=478744 RepID=A0A1H9D3K2_9BACT|nr:hypothetical protein [Neolewinella agarilytica]SEQ08070.1 hypothetical protein SAMN05444359_105134 [Neolewinella agarilytica]
MSKTIEPNENGPRPSFKDWTLKDLMSTAAAVVNPEFDMAVREYSAKCLHGWLEEKIREQVLNNRADG